MGKTGMGRELRKERIACRPCSLNFDDKLLREVPDFCAAYLLRLSFPFGWTRKRTFKLNGFFYFLNRKAFLVCL